MLVINVNIKPLQFQIRQHIKRENMEKLNTIATNAITNQVIGVP